MTPSNQSPSTDRGAINSDTVYISGIDPETGEYAVPPMAIEDVAKAVLARPGSDAFESLHGDSAVPFAAPFGTSLDRPDQVGWGVIFHEETPEDVRLALEPLIDHRRKAVGSLLKVLDYKSDEQIRDWYTRHGISTGNFEPELVPYYLLLVGPPQKIPFEFQYLLGVEYAVGRVGFDWASDYAAYARSVVAYETAKAVKNAKEVVYWGTCHAADPATTLSTNDLIGPLTSGIDDPKTPSLKKPLHEQVGFAAKLLGSQNATKANLLAALCSKRPPSLLFTASHGLWPKAGSEDQSTLQGALLCQDWPGFGTMRPDHYLAASDVPDSADVAGMIFFCFACFGLGTPDLDQFRKETTDSRTAPKLAPQPFLAALPRRLLAHPGGGALAVIGHVDRAWGFSIRPPKASGPQIRTFINMITFTLGGVPVGYALHQNFGQRFSALSSDLLSVLSPSSAAPRRPSDRDLVNLWIERNDAQNFVMLGDPAVRIRTDALGR
jgi:hypothetical protein